MTLLQPTATTAHPDRLADALAKDVAALLEDAAGCDDPDRLRHALWVLAGALPALMVSTEPAEAIVTTARRAIGGVWP